ncbi:MAG: YncE family protein, partial [Senegalia sp. (in: firmicutes)]
MNKNIIRTLLVVIVLSAIGTYYFINNTNDEYLAYIPNVDDGTISVFDTKNKEVQDTIKIGEKVSHGIAATNDGKKIYTGDLDEGKVFVYDTKSKKVTDTIDTGKRIHGIDITPDSKYLLLASGALEVDDNYNYIQIIDTQTDKVIKTIKTNSKSPAHIDFSKDSKIAYVANVMSNDVS